MNALRIEWRSASSAHCTHLTWYAADTSLLKTAGNRPKQWDTNGATRLPLQLHPPDLLSGAGLVQGAKISIHQTICMRSWRSLIQTAAQQIDQILHTTATPNVLEIQRSDRIYLLCETKICQLGIPVHQGTKTSGLQLLIQSLRNCP